MKILSTLKVMTVIGISSATFLMPIQSFAKDYYKWVDSKGSTHYTTTPPPKNAKKVGKVNTYGYNGSSTSVTTNTPRPATDSVPHTTEKVASDAVKPITPPASPIANQASSSETPKPQEKPKTRPVE